MAKGSYKKVISLGLDYSEFQGGIKDCTEEMKRLDSEHKKLSEEMKNSASSSDKFAEKNEYLTKKIELQEKKVNLAREKLEELANSEGATEAQVRRATTAFNNEAAELARLRNELDENVMAQSNLKETSAALVAVITAVSAAVISCAQDVADFADEFNTLSMQSGVAVETLQEWDYASELIDTDFNTMVASLQKLEKTMANSPEKFRELGVRITDASGHMRNAEDVFYDSIDALGRIRNETEQDQAAMDIFGKSATELSGVIRAGSNGLRSYGEEAKSLGLILSSEEVNSAQEMKDAFDRLTKTLEVAKMKIGVQFTPVLTMLANVISSIPAPVLAIISVVGMLSAVVVAAVMTIGNAIKAFQTLSTAIGAANLAMNPDLAMIVLLVAALAVLAVSIKEIIELYREWAEQQKKVSDTTSTMSNSIRSVGHGGGGFSRGGNDHKASGGISRGGMTWVGENGPELVDLPNGARVYNSNESKQIANNPTYNISMNVDITKLKSVNDVVSAIQGLGMSASVGGAI